MNRFAKTVIVLSAASLLLTVVQPAMASVQQVTTHTKMTVSDKSIHKGQVVKFKVQLKAGVAKCIKHMKIKLLMNGNKVAKKKTNNKGKVVFKRHPKKTAKWQARFPGKKTGTHPNRLNCLPSASKKIKVTVKP